MSKSITLVMTTDKNYIIPTRVSIVSLLISATKETVFKIHIMCSEELDYLSRKKILELEKYFKKLTIEFNEIDDKYLKEAKTFSRFPIASYYRLFVSQIVISDKCLFMDGDTIVRGDIGILYEIDIEDYYVAGVKDAQIKNLSNHEEQLGIPSLKGYINAGILLFNLKKIREDKRDVDFINAISDGYKLMDQDIINKYCYGKIKYLPLKFNYFADFYERKNMQNLNEVYSADEFQRAEKELCVLHYNGFFKPWLCTRLKVNQIWWKYARKALENEDIEKQMEKALRFEEESDWSYILKRTKNESQIVIAGFSEVGKELLKLINKFMPNKIAGICDNDIKKQNTNYFGILVQSIESAALSFPKAFWIIASQNGYVQLVNQLKGLGIREEKIIRFINKSAIYYEGLDKKNYDFEMHMLSQN